MLKFKSFLCLWACCRERSGVFLLLGEILVGVLLYAVFVELISPLVIINNDSRRMEP